MENQVANVKIEEENLRVFENDIKFVYFGRTAGTNEHKGVVCVGYKTDKTGTVLRMAVAFCSPSDIFEKQESRRRVVLRMNGGAFEELVKDPNEISEDNPLFSAMRYEEVVALISTAFNSAVPDKWSSNYRDYLNGKQVYPTFAKIKIPWWIGNVLVK